MDSMTETTQKIENELIGRKCVIYLTGTPRIVYAGTILSASPTELKIRDKYGAIVFCNRSQIRNFEIVNN